MRRAVALYSGGKDSTFSVVKSIDAGLEIATLLTIIPKRIDSWMYHSINLKWTRLQAESMGIPQIVRGSSGIREVEVEDLKLGLEEAIKKYEVDTVVVGAYKSRYQKSRVEKVAEKLGLEVYAPLWMVDEESLIETYVNNLEILVVGVSAMGLGEEWLGRILDVEALRELRSLKSKYKISLVGEGGEYETFVTDAPIFNYKIKILKAKKVWMGDSGFYIIEDATLESKLNRGFNQP